MNTLDLIWAVVGFVLSLMIFSYLAGDNPLFRFAVSLFIGVSAGYAAVILLFQVLYPRLVYPLLVGTPLERSFTLVPVVLSLLLFFQAFPQHVRGRKHPDGVIDGSRSRICHWRRCSWNHPTPKFFNSRSF